MLKKTFTGDFTKGVRLQQLSFRLKKSQPAHALLVFGPLLTKLSLLKRVVGQVVEDNLMSVPVVSRFSAILCLGSTRTTYSRLAVARFYASKKGNWCY